jgi:hypothetical protein
MPVGCGGAVFRGPEALGGCAPRSESVTLQVSDVAGKEHAIELALDKMQREWEGTEMQVGWEKRPSCLSQWDGLTELL